MLKPGLRPQPTWVHCNNVTLFVQLEQLLLAVALLKWGWGSWCGVSVGPQHKLFPQEKNLWMTWWLTGRCPWRALVSCLECQCQHTAGWEFVEGACACENVCVFIYVHGGRRVWEKTSERESVWLRVNGKAEWERIKSRCTCTTYVWVYPCICGLRKYKTQKGFWCNMHLSVSVFFLYSSVKVKMRTKAVNY